MDDLDLDDLISALREVAAASDPDSVGDLDPNNDLDDSDDKDPNDDPENDDRDPLDDPRSYPDDDDDSDDDGDNFAKPKSFKTIMLLEKIESDILKNRNSQRLEAIQRVAKPLENFQKDRKRISTLRAKTNGIRTQLQLKSELETESARHLQATMELREANLTPAEKKAQADETRRGQILYSRLIPELHPDWKSRAQAEFNSKKL